MSRIKLIIYNTKIKQKGFYYYSTKYAVLSGWLIFLLTLLADTMSKPNDGVPAYNVIIIILITAIPLSLCQLLISMVFPHQVYLYESHLSFRGPWNIWGLNIKYANLQSIEYNERVLLVKPKWPGITKIYIMEPLDPDKEILDALLHRLKSYPQVSIKEHAEI